MTTGLRAAVPKLTSNEIRSFWAAWIGWAMSSTAVLVSFFTSQLALRKAIKQLDREKLTMERPGGLYDLFTAFLNLSGLVLFLFGLCMMISFLNFNLKIK